MNKITRISPLTAFIAFASLPVLAQVDIPLTNWTVPPYTASSARGGITTMADVTAPRAFIGVAPCRVVDTRGNGAPIQGGIFANSESRTWDITSICGIPAGADAISTNFTVTGSPSAPPGAILLAWPTGQAQPTVSLLNFQANQTIANAAILPLGPGEQINVAVSHSTHVIMDVNGYFSDTLGAPQNFFRLENNSSAQVMEVYNSSLTCTGDCGLVAIVDSNENAGAVLGWYRGGGIGAGVSGTSLGNISSAGIRGSGQAGTGVEGTSRFYNGVVGVTQAATGIFDSPGNFQAGVFGRAPAQGNRGILFGGRFITESTSLGAAGVRGEDFAGASNPVGHVSNPPAGVLGLSDNNFGVLGVCDGTCQGATGGRLYSTINGSIASAGYLGFSTTVGVRFINGLSGTGTKSFIEPHPTDASKTISYVSLEGNEGGTYFRGRGRFDRGVATIDIPEDFRMVTHEDGLSIQVTPIGEMATVAVAHIGLDRIVVRGSRSVDFFYTVNGVRRAYPVWNPIVPNENDFVPESADAKLPGFLSEDERARLIRNGTYKADGSVNMETARRLGWDRLWESKGRPATLP